MKRLILIVSILCLLVGIIINRSLHYEYSPSDAADYVTEHASAKSQNLCGYAVRKAIEAGGCPTFGYPSSATDYVNFLPGLGFTEIDSKEQRQKGDVVVFESVDGHPHGHIAMWNGKQWVSDFKQKGIIVNRAYERNKARYYRQTSGKHKRKLFI